MTLQQNNAPLSAQLLWLLLYCLSFFVRILIFHANLRTYTSYLFKISLKFVSSLGKMTNVFWLGSTEIFSSV